jgi:hypothetical protein
MRNRLFLLIAILLFSIASVLAQDLAALVVTVADPSAAIIPGASVALFDLHRGTIHKGETGSSGFYTFDSLPPGEYSLEVEKTGFNKYVAKSVTLAVRDRQTIRVELQVAPAAGATVNVSDTSGTVSTDATQGVTLSHDYVENLPVNGRNVESMILMAPGVTSASDSGSDFNVNGLRSNTNYYTMDGLSVNRPVGSTGGGFGGRNGGGFGGAGGAAGGGSSSSELISIDAMQEMRVQTSSFAPEFGRSPGAQIVLTSRGGSNTYHGSIYDYLRNQRFDANDWFANAAGFSRGAERQDRPGGTFGGALKKNKTFFFVALEHLDLVSPSSVIASVPNLTSRLAAPAALRPFLDAFPIPNGPVLDAYTSQYRAVVSNPSEANTGSLRVDQVINSSTTAFARISYTPSSSTQRASEELTPNVLTFGDVHSETGSAGFTRNFKNGMVNDLRFNFSKYVNQATSVMDSFGGAVPLTDAEIFPKNVSAANGSFSLSAFGLAGYSLDNRTENDQEQYNIVDSLSRTAGPHQLKFGGDYRKLLGTTIRKPYGESVSFNGVDGNTNALITGLALNAQVTSHTPEVYPTYTNVSAYAQDTWRVTQWTTITYGLRWDLNPAPTARQGPPPFALSNDSVAGVTQNQPLYQTAWFNVAPRFGIAYNMDERPGHEMTIRAGVGLFYDLGYGVTGGAFNGAPYSNVRTISNITFPLTLANLNPPGLPAARPYGQIFSADPNLQSPIVTQWNVTWEHSYGIGQVLSLSYVGTMGRRLSRTDTQAAFTPAYDILTTATNGADSDYHGLQVQFRKRLSRAFQVQASWTYSHAIDSASSDAGGGGFATLFNGGERGSSDYDIRHNVNVSGSYRIPAPLDGAMFSPIRNWFFDFVGTARTGLPFGIQGVSTSTSTITTSTGTVTTTSTGLFANVRPDYLGQPVYIDDSTVPGGRRVNIAAFSIPTGFVQGDLGRNALRGFGEYQLDLALRKQISINERFKLNLAAHGYNITNHPNFANVSPLEGGNMSSPDFGIVTQMLNQSFGAGGVSSLYRAGGPRSMELSIRLQF